MQTVFEEYFNKQTITFKYDNVTITKNPSYEGNFTNGTCTDEYFCDCTFDYTIKWKGTELEHASLDEFVLSQYTKMHKNIMIDEYLLEQNGESGLSNVDLDYYDIVNDNDRKSYSVDGDVINVDFER
jgi:hypothetical protein